MVDAREILEMLDQQCGDYRAMYAVGLEQRDCIEREDLPGLESAFARMQELMDRVRLRQLRMPDSRDGGPEAVAKIDALRHLLHELEGVRHCAQAGAEKLLAETRNEMRQMGKGQRAYRGYRSAGPGQSRLYDGIR
ncbi:MAG: hypothetical protein VX293_11920 [Candidatus Latescibacterota bacterium]|nr:hypothetical protein [Candidatus Latescibacterota bacterium]